MRKITGYTRRNWKRSDSHGLCLRSVIVLFLACLCWTAKAQTVKISGSVVDAQSKEPVPLVNIYTKSMTKGTATDEHGHFLITINRSDTLIFSSVGFENYLFHLKEDARETMDYFEVVIEMNPKTYELDPVKVTAYPSIEQFKHDVLALDIPTEEKGIKLEIPKGYKLPPDGAVLPNGNGLSGGVGVSISAIYDAFSRETKQRKKMKAYKQEQADHESIDAKYNLEVVKRVTNLDDEKAKQFMEWCKFEDNFILQSTDYELAVAMLKCLEKFPATSDDKE